MNKKILLVEDDEFFRKVLRAKLADAGVQVSEAKNGKEAMEKILVEEFDVVLLDLVMPVMDGFGVLEELKERKIKTKIIVMSSLEQQSDIEKTKQMGAVEHLDKGDLEGIVKKVMD